MTFGTIFWIVAVGVAVIYLWRSGQLMRFANYVRETREELKKCTWPTWNELKGSTVVVMVAIFILGGFTVVVDRLIFGVMYLIT